MTSIESPIGGHRAARGLAWLALCIALCCAALGLQPASAQLPGVPGVSSPGGCDPTVSSCVPPKCTPLDEALGKCTAGGGGTVPMCVPPVDGAPSCSPISHPASTGGMGGGVDVGGGNPINLVTGDKYQLETDLAPLPGVLGLELRRHYNSLSAHAGLIGAGWHMSYETVLYDLGSQIEIVQADGQRLVFHRGVGSQAALCTAAQPGDGQVTIETDRGGQNRYLWRWPDGRKLQFSGGSNGGHPLQTITAATGERLTLTYSPAGDLVQVRDPQGRKLDFIYNARRALQAIDTPLGRFDYSLDAQGRLAQVATHVDGDAAPPRVRIYHYEDRFNGGHPNALTGISLRSFDGASKQWIEQRLSTYAYGSDGRAILTTKGEPAQLRDGKVVAGTGIEQLQVAYIDKALPGDGPADASGAVHPRHLGKTIITNGLGQKSELLSAIIGNHYRLVEFAGPGCATCGTANMRYDYNASGQLLRAIHIDAQRKPVSATVFQYDVHGRSVREGVQEFSGAKAQPVQWRRRLEYHDVPYPDGSVALGWRPILVAEPSVVAGRERVLRYSYNDQGQTTQVSESGFSPVDERGQPVAQGMPISRVTSYRYRTVGSRSLLAEIDGPLPNGPTASPADSDVVRIDYDAEGNFVTGWTAPGGMRFTASEFDVAGRPHALTSDDGAHPVSLRLAFLPTGDIERLTYTAGTGPKPEQRVFRYEYDALGRPVLQAGPDGVVLRSLYDIAGHLTHQVLPDGSQQVDAYDLDGHRTETAMYGPGGTAGMVRHYDFQGDQAMGFIQQAIAPARGASGALSDVFARQAVTQSPGLLSDRFVRADGSIATRRRDDFDRVVQVTMPGRGPDSAHYDEAGRVVQWRNAAGVTTSITRDPAGRPLEVSATTRDGQQERTTYRYQGAALAREVHWIGAREDSRLEWQIDRWGAPMGKRLVVAAAGAGSRPVALALQRQTDAAGRPLRETFPSGAVVTYDYDTSGRVRSMALDGHRLVGGVVHEASRGGMAVTGYVQGDGLIHARELDADRRLRALQDGPQRRTFALDDEGHIRHVERSQPAPAGAPAAAASAPASVEDYGYDQPGHLTWEQADGQRSATLAYTPLGERTGPSRSTDGAGQVLQRGPQRLDYNAQGQVASVHQLDGTEVASYRYDGDGVRVAKRVQGRDTLFLYDDEDRLVAEAHSDGAVVAEYVYLDGKPIARLTPRTGAPVAVAYLRTDQRGGVEGMATPEGHVTWAARLDAFGSPHMQVGDAQDMPLRLPGQYADEETGLYYNVHRYYDPQRGEYLQPDPAGPAAGSSAYAYVASDPLGASDPRGLTLEPDPEAGGFNPALFGTMVHSQFSNQVRALGPGWGGNDGRFGTWPGGLGGLQPDAYSVDPVNLRNEMARRSFSGQLWELKPISYRADAMKYSSAATQVTGYTTGATRGCWTTGSSQALVGQLSPTEVIYDGKIWDIRYVQDTPARDTSGILFYTKRPSSRILDPVTAPAPAPAMSPADKARLQRSVDDVKDEGAREGWSPLTILGVVVLIGLAIAALVWLAGAAIAALVTAIIGAIATALAEAAAGALTLMAGLAAIFGYGPVMAAEANTEGTKEKAGLLDSVVGWFRGWF